MICFPFNNIKLHHEKAAEKCSVVCGKKAVLPRAGGPNTVGLALTSQRV